MVFICISLGAIGTMILLPPIPQDPQYHAFADDRGWLGVHNFLNVLSNLPFLVVGVMGLLVVANPQAPPGRSRFLDRGERWPYAAFFLGVALTSLGSAYYHLAPTNERLAWDRLPITVAFMGLFVAIIAERVSVRAGVRLLLPLVALGITTVLYWVFTEQRGHGDLRPYGLVQFYPLLAIPFLIVLCPPRYTRTWDLAGGLAFYLLAKLFEVLDTQVFAVGAIVSGHTLKHLAAAIAPLWIWRMLRRRKPYLPTQV